MARRARTLLSVVVAALILLEATPSLPRATAARASTGRCEIAATDQSVALVAIAAERGALPSDGLTFERNALGTFTIVAGTAASPGTSSAMLRRSDGRRRTGAAWVRALQQRARSPGDPEPL